MSPDWIYLLEHCETGQPTIVGLFSSRQAAEDALRPLDPTIAYAIYKLPLNTIVTRGPKLEDQQGIYDHWHYGTHEVHSVEVDADGTAHHDIRTELLWPD